MSRDRHPAGGGGGVSGLVGNGVGQGVDVAGGFVRYLDGGGQVAVTAVSGGGSRVLEQVIAGDGDLRLAGEGQLRGLPVLHMDQALCGVAAAPEVRLIGQGIVPGDVGVHLALHGDGGVGGVAAPQQPGPGVRVGGEGGDVLLRPAVELHMGGRQQNKIAPDQAQHADDNGGQQQGSPCGQGGNGFLFHEKVPLNQFCFIL